jgi:hypothetical protein
VSRGKVRMTSIVKLEKLGAADRIYTGGKSVAFFF